MFASSIATLFDNNRRWPAKGGSSLTIMTNMGVLDMSK
jgi:hypothetical protein